MAPNTSELMAYVVALEIEVDRLRGTNVLLQQQVLGYLRPVKAAADRARPVADAQDVVQAIDGAITNVGELFHDFRQPVDCRPAQDQVVAIAVRPIIEQAFRFQKRIHSAREAQLHLELELEHIEWFPSRFRHILDCLLSNAVRYRDNAKGEARVTVGLRTDNDKYVLRISDNGVGFDWNEQVGLFELLHRIAPDRTGLGVGLAVTKLLIDQAGGTLTVTSKQGQGSSFVAHLPRFDTADFLESVCQSEEATTEATTEATLGAQR